MSTDREADITRHNEFTFTHGKIDLTIKYWGDKSNVVDQAIDQMMLTVFGKYGSVAVLNKYIEDNSCETGATKAVSERTTKMNDRTVKVEIEIEVSRQISPLYLGFVLTQPLDAIGVPMMPILDNEAFQQHVASQQVSISGLPANVVIKASSNGTSPPEEAPYSTGQYL